MLSEEITSTDEQMQRLMYLEVNDRAGRYPLSADYVLLRVLIGGFLTCLVFLPTNNVLFGIIGLVVGGMAGWLVGVMSENSQKKRWDSEARRVAVRHGYNYLGFRKGFEKLPKEVLQDPANNLIEKDLKKNWLLNFAKELDVNESAHLMPKVYSLFAWIHDNKINEIGFPAKCHARLVYYLDVDGTDILDIRQIQDKPELSFSAISGFETYYSNLRVTDELETAVAASIMMVLYHAQMDAQGKRYNVQYVDREMAFDFIRLFEEQY